MYCSDNAWEDFKGLFDQFSQIYSQACLSCEMQSSLRYVHFYHTIFNLLKSRKMKIRCFLSDQKLGEIKGMSGQNF
jgi:hypothetical protein